MARKGRFFNPGLFALCIILSALLITAAWRYQFFLDAQRLPTLQDWQQIVTKGLMAGIVIGLTIYFALKVLAVSRALRIFYIIWIALALIAVLGSAVKGTPLPAMLAIKMNAWLNSALMIIIWGVAGLAPVAIIGLVRWTVISEINVWR